MIQLQIMKMIMQMMEKIQYFVAPTSPIVPTTDAILSTSVSISTNENIDKYFKLYESFKPPILNGRVNARAAKNYIVRIGKTLNGMKYLYDKRVSLAVCTLEGEEKH